MKHALLIFGCVSLALLCVLPVTQSILPFSLITRGAQLAEVMFHEMGHAIFGWAFGVPAIPSILTLFGSDQAGGFTLTFERVWLLQCVAWGVMAYGCYWLWQANDLYLFWPAAVISALMVPLAFWPHYTLIPMYMGHGGAMLAGGFFLYRGFLGLDARHMFEQGLNLFLGAFLLLHNAFFAWSLAFDAAAQADYTSQLIGGAVHHDFMAMHEEWFRLSVSGIAQATVGSAVLIALAAILLAYIRRNDYTG